MISYVAIGLRLFVHRAATNSLLVYGFLYAPSNNYDMNCINDRRDKDALSLSCYLRLLSANGHGSGGARENPVFERLSLNLRSASKEWQHLIIYEIDTDDVSAARAELARRFKSGEVMMDDSMANERVSYMFRPITPMIEKGLTPMVRTNAPLGVKALPHRVISLHQLTALDADPVDLIDIAGASGYDAVCVFVHAPKRKDQFSAQDLFRTVTHKHVATIRARLRERNMQVCNVEYFPIDENANPADWIEALDVAAEIGATRATAHVHDTDWSRAADRFAQLCDLGGRRGLRIGLEFNARSKCPTIDDAASFLTQAAASNSDIVLDTLHLMRSGGTAADVRRHRDRIGYVQICDGPLLISASYLDEALFERKTPGAGEFPLASLLDAAPADVPISVEMPSRTLQAAGVTPHDRAAMFMQAVRGLVPTGA
jgi:sugar phosphate isomerase/epimerase